MTNDVTTMHEGKHLRMRRKGSWEFAERCTASGVVTIVPITVDDQLLFTEQFRPPVGKPVIEFPAGLAGDILGAEQESLLGAARRELREETGYEADGWTELATCPTSAGMSNEIVTFFLATGLRQVSMGGGDSSEQIKIHHVDRSQVSDWLTQMVASGCLIAAQVYAGLYFIEVTRGPEQLG